MGESTKFRKEFAARLNAALDELPGCPKGHGRQKFLGILFNVTSKGARQWLKGTTMPITSGWVAMANDLNVRLEWLFFGLGPMRQTGSPEVNKELLKRIQGAVNSAARHTSLTKDDRAVLTAELYKALSHV